MNPEILRLKSNDGLKIHCRIWNGSADQKEIWIVHGMGDHGGRYIKLAEALADNNFRVILADNRGNGLSEGKRGHATSLDTLLDDLKMVIDSTQSNANRKFILGQSLGGLIVARFLMSRHQDFDAAILMSPMFRTTSPSPKIKLFIARWIKWIHPTLTFRAKFRTNDLTSDESVKETYRLDELKHDMVSASLGLSLFENGELALKEANRISIPTLVMHGDIDKITSHAASKEFAEKSNSVEFKTWPNGRHELHNESDKSKVFSYLIDWLDEFSI